MVDIMYWCCWLHIFTLSIPLSVLQITLEQALALCQKYHFRMQSACEWLEDAVAFLQLASLGVDVENYEECLRQQEDIMASEQVGVPITCPGG